MRTLAQPMPVGLRTSVLTTSVLVATQTLALPLLLRAWEQRRRRERFLPLARPAMAVGAMALGTFALGSLALGALTIGAMSLGSLGIGSTRLKKVHIQSLTVDELNLPTTSPVA